MTYLPLAIATLLAATSALAAKTGAPAPDFKVLGADGKEHTLAEYKGKTLVLEWLNHGCPYVKKHYQSGNMQKLQKKYTGQGVAWLSVISSAPGKQGASTAEEASAAVAEHQASPTTVLLDTDGKMGRAYGAKTTPHMFVIDPKGTLAYNGAIDDRPTTELSDVPAAKSYVAAAIEETMAGKPVKMANSKPYGCSVKY